MKRYGFRRRIAGVAAALILAAGFGEKARAAADKLHFLTSSMYTYSMLQEDLSGLKRRYGGVVSDSIGTTPDGRQIYRVELGNRGADKKILVVASMHAREYITTPLVMRQIKDLLDQRAAGDTRLDEVCVQVIPMLNPDGVAISQYALDGLVSSEAKRKLRGIIQSWADWGLLEDQNKYDWYLNKWKNNANGVDLNRNFPTAGWAALKDLRDKPASDLYKGPAAASEPETRALMELVQRERFSEVVNYHSQGQIIYWANSRAPREVWDRNEKIAAIAKADTGYPLVAPAAEGLAEGCSFKDWLDGYLSVPNITVEVGLGTAPVPEEQIETIWEQNRKLLPDLIDELLGKYQFPAFPEVRLDSAPEALQGDDVKLRFVAPREE